jgi:hypothetical protein
MLKWVNKKKTGFTEKIITHNTLLIITIACVHKGLNTPHCTVYHVSFWDKCKVECKKAFCGV